MLSFRNPGAVDNTMDVNYLQLPSVDFFFFFVIAASNISQW